MATPAQEFRQSFEAMASARETPAQAFRLTFNEIQAKDATALYISPRLS